MGKQEQNRGVGVGILSLSEIIGAFTATAALFGIVFWAAGKPNQKKSETNSVMVEEDKPEPQEKPQKSALPNIVEIITSITAVIALLGIAFWLAGKSYTDGYLAALNIPINHVSFPADDYQRLGWYALLTKVLDYLIPRARIVLWVLPIMYLVGLVLNALDEAQRTKIIEVFNRIKEVFSVPVIFRTVFRWMILFVIVIFVLIAVLLQLEEVAKLGEATGKDFMLKNTQVIELVSRAPLELGIAELTTSPSDNKESSIYVYKGFRLLTYSEGKYYLFKELDPNTCKPNEVYIIDEQELIQVKVFPGSPLDIECIDSEATDESPQPTEIMPSLTP